MNAKESKSCHGYHQIRAQYNWKTTAKETKEIMQKKLWTLTIHSYIINGSHKNQGRN